MIRPFLTGFAAAIAAFGLGRRRDRRDRPAGTSAAGAADDANDTDDTDRRRFVGIIAHELRTPTSIILGYQELLAEGLLGPVSDRSRDALERIRRAAAQLRDLTDGLEILTGDVPRLAGGNGSIVDAAEAAGRVVLAATPDAEARGLDIRWESNGPAPVHAEPDPLDRLLDLMIAAAIRTSPVEPLVLDLHTNDRIITCVTRGAIFDTLQHGPALLSRADAVTSGIGLRIAIAQRIAISLGGALDLDDQALRLTLPVALAGGEHAPLD